ncbi:MAG: DUF4062 domain-containing protein [Candidatus Hydrogenedentota bacterium]|nr:MAG: DUF4062 domain-containing protein [Candidatus Hydrogenedentota bacterium]
MSSEFTVFICSSMKEFGTLRGFLAPELRKNFEVFLYETGAGARPETPRCASLEEVERADAIVAILGRQYGPITIEELCHALELEKPCFVYVLTLVEARDSRLQKFIEERLSGADHVSYSTFSGKDLPAFTQSVGRDITLWMARELRRLQDVLQTR